MKKGFTLIELLAVIVILAIIALIATPIILGIIEDARKGSIEASANGYIDAVEYKIASNEIKGEETSNGVYDVTEIDIDLDGEKPTYGEVTIEKGNVKEAFLCINGYTVEVINNKSSVVGKCGEEYKEVLLNGADPVLKDELVPVTISNNGEVTKANLKSNWYSYRNKKWANAVILFGEDKYKEGDLIDETNIKEYYVWIPKYAYKLWNVNGDNSNNIEKPIEIVFGSKAKTTGKNNGDMYLHPAFTNFGTEGIWAGKFETSYNEETYTNQDLFLEKNPNYESATKSSEIIIKPNIRALNKKSISEYHALVYNSHRNLDSHMMTNMEWGATAYLTYSIYGRCDSETCTEVTINNINNGYLGSNPMFDEQWDWGTTITGCAADNISGGTNSNQDSCDNPYNREKGYLASTTGNITGIYDMSGGNWEYVMGVLIQEDGTLFSGTNNIKNSGFKGLYGCPNCEGNTSNITENIDGIDFPNKKYYNTYINKSEMSTDYWYNRSSGLLGDATIELTNLNKTPVSYAGLWFNDGAIFLSPSYPWFARGGSYNVSDGAGIMFYARNTGLSADGDGSTRVVLAF